jgi:chromosomal replication initiation ATPase DnaA
MNDFTYQQTLPLRLIPSYGRHDFIVGESNEEAVNWIDNFSKTNIKNLIIIGPSSSGKSHLVSIIQCKNKFEIVDPKNINAEKIDILKLKNVIIENVEKINNHKFFLHIINILKEKNFKLILTSRLSINEMNIQLRDLKSRLLTFPQSKILLPTDDVLRGIIIKISKDKGLPLNNQVINFILNHVDRSYSVINNFINKLDKISLSTRKKITIPMVKSLLK